MRLLAFALLALAACSSSPPPPASATADDAGSSIDASDAAIDKSATCASQFGAAIGSLGFARFDGTVVAIIPPGDHACPEPNSTHLIVQLRTGGDVYRMVVDVDDTSARGSIHTATLAHPLPAPAWSDGWHTTTLDYPTTLGAHASAFATTSTADAVAAITSAIDLGTHVSVYATAQGEADSAHLVHREGAHNDGAIVLAPESASPSWLLFSFADQSF